MKLKKKKMKKIFSKLCYGMAEAFILNSIVVALSVRVGCYIRLHYMYLTSRHIIVLLAGKMTKENGVKSNDGKHITKPFQGFQKRKEDYY